MGVPLRRRGLGGVAWHRVRGWRHHDGRVGMAYRDLGVDILAIVGAVAGKGCHCSLDLIKQGTDLGAVIGILVGQHGQAFSVGAMHSIERLLRVEFESLDLR